VPQPDRRAVVNKPAPATATGDDPDEARLGGRYVECDSDQRYGPTLRSITAAAAAAELADIVYPPTHLDRPVLDRYLGLANLGIPPPADDKIPGASQARVLHLAERLSTFGRTVRLRPELWPEVSLTGTDRIDNARRARVARALALPPPVSPGALPAWLTPRVARGARIGMRVLAAVGPLYLDDVADAIANSHHMAVDAGADHLAAALLVLGAHFDSSDGRWQHTGAADRRDAALISAALATGRQRHTRAQAVDLLMRAGYHPIAEVPKIRHPLVHRIARDQYRILGAVSPVHS